MQYLITYGSQYGSTEKYARNFAEKTRIAVIPYCEVNNVITQDTEKLDAKPYKI